MPQSIVLSKGFGIGLSGFTKGSPLLRKLGGIGGERLESE